MLPPKRLTFRRVCGCERESRPWGAKWWIITCSGSRNECLGFKDWSSGAIFYFNSRKRWLRCCTTVNNGVASSLSSSKCICSFATRITKIYMPLKTTASFERWYLEQVSQHLSIFSKDKPLGLRHGWLKISGSPRYPHYDWLGDGQAWPRSLHGIWVNALGLSHLSIPILKLRLLNCEMRNASFMFLLLLRDCRLEQGSVRQNNWLNQS